jgi:hypothetical protein
MGEAIGIIYDASSGEEVSNRKSRRRQKPIIFWESSLRTGDLGALDEQTSVVTRTNLAFAD